MADIITKCCICEADFRPGGLDKDGKCVSCRVQFPTVKNKKEAMALHQPEINLGAKATVDDVKQIVKEAINELKAELKADAIKTSKADAAAKARAAKQDNKNEVTLGSNDGTLGDK